MNEIIIREKNELSTTTKPRKKKELIKYLTKEQIEEGILRAKKPLHKLLISFLWLTGVRISEALSVKKKDINLEERTITIRWLKNRKQKERIIPIHNKLYELLSFVLVGYKYEDRLFPITRQQAHNIIKKYLNTHPHTLRHSFAIHYLKNGGKIEELQKLLGHRYITSTAVYSQYCIRDLSEKLNKIEF